MTMAPTYRDVLLDGTRRLERAGIEAARFEARLMLQELSGMDAARWIISESERAPAELVDRFDAMIDERVTRRPLQHILGTTEFYGLEFLCDGRALIPRPDSEVVVEAALARLPDGEAAFVADLGTGSGCLLAAILANRPHASGEGVEASADAAALAQENLSRLGLAGRASIHVGPWSGWTKWGEADLIISNPPYIVSAEMAGLMPEVRDHDPAPALDGGADGLDAYREIVRLAATAMKPGAWLVFEIGYDQKQAVSGLLAAAGFEAIICLDDLGGNNRAVAAQCPVV